MSVRLLKENVRDEKQMRAYYSETIVKMIEDGKPVIALDADLMRAVGLLPYRKNHPDRIFDCGIAEANMMGVAAGLSAEGFVPFAHSFAAFASRRAFDQVYMSGAYAKLNVKVVGSDPGVCAALNGGTHQANEDMALMTAVPDMTVVEPSDSVMLLDLMPQIADTYGMFYLRLFRLESIKLYEPGSTFELGKAVMLRDGSDATIIACGIEVAEAVKAADMLAGEGLSIRVLDMFTVKPIDRDAVLAAAADTGAIVTAENHNVIGGLGDAVARVLCAECPTPLVRIGIQDIFGEVGSTPMLMERFGLTAKDIAAKVRETIARK